jgi:hypothetical protein
LESEDPAAKGAHKSLFVARKCVTGKGPLYSLASGGASPSLSEHTIRFRQNLLGKFYHFSSTHYLFSIIVAETKNLDSDLSARILEHPAISMTQRKNAQTLFGFPGLPQERKSGFLYATLPLAFSDDLSSLNDQTAAPLNGSVGSVQQFLSFPAEWCSHLALLLRCRPEHKPLSATDACG